MTPQNSHWAANLKFLRLRRKMSQENLAEQLEISRSKLVAHEMGQTKNPPLEDLIKFSAFFKISIDSLIKINISKLSELKLRELEAGNDVYMMGGNIRVVAITVNKENKENVEYVPVKAKAGYSAGYQDPEFIAALPKYSLPNLPKQGTFRIFPITGDSMLPIPDGSDILTKYVEDWKGLKKDTPCIVILKGNQDFVFKLVRIESNNDFLLSSLNTLYEPYVVNPADVLEVWKFYSFTSNQFPAPESDLKQLAKMTMELYQEVRQLKSTK